MDIQEIFKRNKFEEQEEVVKLIFELCSFDQLMANIVSEKISYSIVILIILIIIRLLMKRFGIQCRTRKVTAAIQ